MRGRERWTLSVGGGVSAVHLLLVFSASPCHQLAVLDTKRRRTGAASSVTAIARLRVPDRPTSFVRRGAGPTAPASHSGGGRPSSFGPRPNVASRNRPWTSRRSESPWR